MMGFLLAIVACVVLIVLLEVDFRKKKPDSPEEIFAKGGTTTVERIEL